jgi:hypothetical protein
MLMAIPEDHIRTTSDIHTAQTGADDHREGGAVGRPPRLPPTHPRTVLRGATLDIVCLIHLAEPKGPGSNNVKNGTSAERFPAPFL